MKIRGILFVLVATCLPCHSEELDARNVTAVYLGNGSIVVTWQKPVNATAVSKYLVRITSQSEKTSSEFVTEPFYLLDSTIPNTTYMFEVSSVINIVSGMSIVTIHTDPAVIKPKGSAVRLHLPPLPPASSIVSICFNEQDLFTFVHGTLLGNSTKDGKTIHTDSSNIVLHLNSVTQKHAGYYYSMIKSGKVIVGGQLLVVTDIPTKPIIRVVPSVTPVKNFVTLVCSSRSRSKPDNHGLRLTSSWKLNGADIIDSHFTVSGLNLIVDSKALGHGHGNFTCVASEMALPIQQSERSETFTLYAKYGPLFITIEPPEGLPPLIFGEDYTPILCKTDCYPACLLKWIWNSMPLKSDDTDNYVKLDIYTVPREREVTFTCIAENNATSQRLRKNITVEIYYSPEIHKAMYTLNGGSKNPLNSVSASENDNLQIHFETNSNPKPDITIEGYNVAERVVAVIHVSEGHKYFVNINSLKCNQTGGYSIIATNIVTKTRSSVPPTVKNFTVDVKCTPRLAEDDRNLIEKAGEIGDVILIGVTVLSNPIPRAKWDGAVTPFPVESINQYTYMFQGHVTIRHQSDFRDYVATIMNGLERTEPVLQVFFRIRTKGVPDTPVNFIVSDKGPDYITVSWVSGFNGGSSQFFNVTCYNAGNKLISTNLNIHDKGNGKLMSSTITQLMEKSEYVIILDVSNKFGFGNSSELNVTTGKFEKRRRMNNEIVVAVLASILCVVTFVSCGAIINDIRNGRSLCSNEQKGRQYESVALGNVSNPAGETGVTLGRIDYEDMISMNIGIPSEYQQVPSTSGETGVTQGRIDYEDMISMNIGIPSEYQQVPSTSGERERFNQRTFNDDSNPSDSRRSSPYAEIRDSLLTNSEAQTGSHYEDMTAGNIVIPSEYEVVHTN